jgi:hypothetical protein
MSEGEAFLFFALAPIALIYWGMWFRAAFCTSPLVRPNRRIIILGLCFVVCLGIVLVTLLTAADPVVRRDVYYIVLFLEIAAVALAAVTAAASLIGVSPLDDAIRRPNPAAVWATAGLWIGTALTCAGANIGRGDTIGTTNGPLVLGVATLVFLWGALTAVVGTSSITQDRDSRTGIRHVGLSIAWGLIMARAMAGDWESVARTMEDYVVQGGPALLLLLIAVPVEWFLRPSVRRPARSSLAGIVPAIVYLGVALGWVLWLGKP